MVAAVAILFALFATACGGGTIDIADVTEQRTDNTDSTDNGDNGDNNRSDAETTERRTVPEEEPTAVPPTPEPVPESSLEDVALATVKISAQGTFVAPGDTAQSTVAGIGSGFIIDESGLMVTNNHVVTGAAIIEVFLPGENSPTNARLLGVSECSDLAVLDLEGEGYPTLEFRDSMSGINPGLTVFSAGYPLNFDVDIESVDYTLTTGIVSTTQAAGETNWTSVDGVIEHDARIRGGNSGGPLVDENGRVIGINFAGDDVNDLNFAITALDALPTIEALKIGDVESLGINGQAIVTEEVNGVWVSAVASGSPADQAGVQAGDLILTMEGLDLATDGTMADYCDIIRTNGTDATLSIEVLRLGSEEVLTGQINGTPLVQSFSFMQELSSEVGGTDTGSLYTEYEFVSDDTESVGVEVPVQWSDHNGAINQEFGESIYAAPDLEGFSDTWGVPGIIVERNADFGSAEIDTVLNEWTDFDCAGSSGRTDFQTADEFFTGKWEIFTECGGTDTALLTLAVSPPDDSSVVRMLVQIVTDADLEAADRAIATFDAA